MSMRVIAGPPIVAIVRQHAEDSAALRVCRSVLVRAPHIGLHLLRRHDDRLAAHLDGLAVAGEEGWQIAVGALASPGPGELFTVTVLALQSGDAAALGKLFKLAAQPPEMTGVASAFGWVSAHTLRGMAARLLASDRPLERRIGLAACAAHGVDPGPVLARGFDDADEGVRGRALRAAGQLGRADLLQPCIAHFSDEQTACRFQAAWSAILLGERTLAPAVLESIALGAEPYALEALRLLMLASTADRARELMRQLAACTGTLRKAIQAAGWAGDIKAAEWLIRQMCDEQFTRVAGEAFTMLTGADLSRLELERTPSQRVERAPSGDTEDDNIDLDPDDDLPWPEVGRVQAWWTANRSRMPTGRRCFMGATVDEPQCLRVLREGTQRQRAAAALLRLLLHPGTPLFNIAAPGWRQQRALDRFV